MQRSIQIEILDHEDVLVKKCRVTLGQGAAERAYHCEADWTDRRSWDQFCSDVLTQVVAVGFSEMLGRRQAYEVV